jgi:hypothetical protein
MNYNESDKEKIEFTPEGEALGYISLNQAGVLAMEHSQVTGTSTRAVTGPHNSFGTC